jgi:hypothetical protein
VMDKSLLQAADLLRIPGEKVYAGSDAAIFSLDPFNFLPDGREKFIKIPDRVAEIIGI